MTDKLLADYRRYPTMAHWFSPWLLLRLLNNVATSSMFGQYADRRLIVAALDTQAPGENFKRATSLKDRFQSDEDGAVWIDWVADLGDGFDSTYAIASLLARKELAIGDHKLPRGQLLIMGGDEVYPAASEQTYKNQLWQPYEWAFPDHDRDSDEGVPLFAIPGNHDWYDGLVLFLAYFCKDKPAHFGSWRTHQSRSYFAVQITDKFWVWATDIQLADSMDQPQADYFADIASRMPHGSKIILCSAEPGWLYTHTNSKSWRIMDYAIRIASNADRGLTIPLLLSGDTHHYSRYAARDGTQFVTSGGGGAFRHPTHQLADSAKLGWVDKRKEITLATLPATGKEKTPAPACYPPMKTCRWLLFRNLLFAFKNWDFSLLMGGIYWLMAVGVTLRDQWDAYVIVVLIFVGAIMGYTYKQEKSARPAVLITSALHSAAQAAAVILLTRFFSHWNDTHFTLTGEWYSVWKWLGILLIEMGAAGFLIGSTIFGINLLITCLCFRMNQNDAFSAFRLNRYNNFLRLRIKGDSIELYAIGMEGVPRRCDWVANPKSTEGRRTPEEPVFISKVPLRPHIIESLTI